MEIDEENQISYETRVEVLFESGITKPETLDWKKVIFVNESSFQSNSQQKKCWIKEGQSHSIQVQKYPQKIHLFGGISYEGSTRLYIFEGITKGERYKDILQKQIFPDAKKLYPNNDFILLQDRDPKHKSKVVQDYLEFKNCRQFEDWPPNLPDLNPIENLWGIIYQRQRKAKN